MKKFKFDELATADLIVDALYQRGTKGHAGDDPINLLLKCGNQGGFRYRGSISDDSLGFCVLYSDLTNNDWPDSLDFETGRFVYYGDNRQPGHELHKTKKSGNLILKRVFDALHESKRDLIPPFFVFTKNKNSELSNNSVCFRGLAVPGAYNLAPTDDLVAIWKSKAGARFQNYKSIFTILDVSVLSRKWLDSLIAGAPDDRLAPKAFLTWRALGRYEPLQAPPTIAHRKPDNQRPQNSLERGLIETIKDYFEKHPLGEYAFERCAGMLAQIMEPNIISLDYTRPWRDGGRDAIGIYRIGVPSSYTDVEFALEAKCYSVDNACRVQHTSRLISRLRHRQFGIFVTTSYVSEQAYLELIEDRHPVLVLAATDIAKLLISKGINTKELLISWLGQF